MISEVVVIVPAADEEQQIEACLLALRRAAEAVAHTVRVRVVVVLDSCGDRTGEIVGRHQDIEVLVSTARCVGTARALGAAHAMNTTEERRELWLANTDADSLVPADWLVQMLTFADQGAQVVLGTVVPGPELTALARETWQALHDSTDGHSHVHGANLGIRGDSLAALGGWRPLATGEDIDLAERAIAADLRIQRAGGIPVWTSARSVGRAPEGFSSYLRALG